MTDRTSAAWRIRNHVQGTCTPDAIDQNLSLETISKPAPKEGQVLVRIHAASLNYRDLLILTSDPRYPSATTVDGLVPLGDGAGVIEELGPGESKWKVGDKVINATNSTWKAGQTQASFNGKISVGSEDVDGVLRQYAVFNEDSLAPLPGNLTFEEGSCLSGAYVSAWNALFGGPQRLRRGDVVVIQGTGGVSIAALQIAAAVGAVTIAFTTSEDKIALLKRLGATHALNYKDRKDWSEDVLHLTEGRGADHVIDVVGAATISESIRSLRQDGLISAVGFLSSTEKHDLIPDIVFGAKTIRGLMFGSLGMFRDVSAFVEENRIKPVVARVFGWEEVKEGYKAMLGQGFVGKIVVKVE